MKGYSIEFVIPGEPKGKGRARFAKRGNFMQSYTPKETTSYENLVKVYGREAMQGRAPSLGNVQMFITACFSIPQSKSEKKREAMHNTYAPKKPDHDNIAKIVSDALNKIAYDDDKQVVCSTVVKLYSKTPCTKVKLDIYE